MLGVNGLALLTCQEAPSFLRIIFTKAQRVRFRCDCAEFDCHFAGNVHGCILDRLGTLKLTLLLALTATTTGRQPGLVHKGRAVKQDKHTARSTADST